MLIGLVIAVCIVLLILGFVAPRLSAKPQHGVDRTFGTGGRMAGKAPGPARTVAAQAVQHLAARRGQERVGGPARPRQDAAVAVICNRLARPGGDPAVEFERGKVTMARLQDKVALITGGESGIGLATARLFVSEGASVHLVGIDESKLAAAVAELGDERAIWSVADVTDETAVERAVTTGVDRYGRFDVVVSNAGISGDVAPIVDYSSEVFSRTLAVHILGAFHVLKHTIPHVPDGGSIIITSSVVGLIGPPGRVGVRRRQARPGGPDAHRGQGARVAAHPREHDAPRADLDPVPGPHRDACDRTSRRRRPRRRSTR